MKKKIRNSAEYLVIKPQHVFLNKITCFQIFYTEYFPKAQTVIISRRFLKSFAVEEALLKASLQLHYPQQTGWLCECQIVKDTSFLSSNKTIWYGSKAMGNVGAVSVPLICGSQRHVSAVFSKHIALAETSEIQLL